MSRPAFLACVLPPVAALVAVLVFSTLEVAGFEPLSLPRPLNLAEAAGSGQAADVLRRLKDGQDPWKMEPVRAGVISRADLQVNAYEAAVLSRSARLVALMERRTGPLDARTRQWLVCLARDAGARDTVALLAPASPDGCERGAVRLAISERTYRPSPAAVNSAR